jgi:DNA (cytosine-5)-methyltransferase 1
MMPVLAALSSSSVPSTGVAATIQKYGTPVGVVILPNKDIQPFHQACHEALPHLKMIYYRGVDPHISKSSGFKQIHVQTEVAAAIVDGNAHLIEFIRNCGGEFIPGVRRKAGRRRSRGSGRYLKRKCDDDGNENGDAVAYSSNNTNSSSISFDEIEQSPKFTFVELFAGIGGFRLGLEQIGGSCVLASERDGIACEIYRRQFGSDDLVEGDVLDIVSDDFPLNGFDILTAGFPCQPFSLRGEQKGLDDDGHRGQMYQELVRILMEERPKYFLFENVVGLVTMEGGSASHWTGEHIFKSGKVMDRILEAFRNCGYKVEWHVVNSKYFVPQYRERVYFVGSLLELECPDMNWNNIYPPDECKPPFLREFLEKDYATSDTVAECELSIQQWDMVQHKYDEAATTARLKIEEYAPTLISSYRTPGSPTTRFVMEEADGTLRYGNPLRPRFLTPRECCHIMGFPNDFDVSPPYKGEIGHMYQVLGNAVVPPVIEAIGQEMLRLMEQVKAKDRVDGDDDD